MKTTFVTKTDLGQAFFPYISPRSARQKLMQIVMDDATLVALLKQHGYAESSHAFSPRQVEIIVDRLGNPWK